MGGGGGGVEENLGGLKMPKDDLGGVFKFLLNIKGPDFDSVLRKVLYCVILK